MSVNLHLLNGVAGMVRGGAHVVVFAKSEPVATDLLKQCAELVGPSGKVHLSHGAERLVSSAGGVAYFRSRRSTDSIRGHSADVLIFDDCRPTEEQLAVVMPALVAQGGVLVEAR